MSEDDTKKQFFKTQTPAQAYGGPDLYSPVQFHFHAKSEHTIDGKRFDLEMHTVHLPEGYADYIGQDPPQVFASALGLIFDRYSYDPISDADRKIVDDFFESLNLENQETDVFTDDTEIPYGKLKNMVDISNRWVYKGGLTTPPCTRVVFFQVVHRVLPISERHYQAYLRHQSKIENKYEFAEDGSVLEVNPPVTLDVTGNWRDVVPVTEES